MSSQLSSAGQFEELAVPLFDSLYNFAHWLTRNREEAEDLVQETYAKALKGFSTFQPGTNFRAWMFRILKNSFLTSRAGLARYKMISLSDDDQDLELPAATQTPETELLALRDRQAVRQAIEELPIHFQEVLLLCDVEEMSYQEIADAISVPIGTVMSRLWRARRAVKQTLLNRTQKAKA